MGILGDTNPQTSAPLSTSQFPGDSLLGRMARGNFTPAAADLEELQRLAQSGNRAERRAAAKHLKKQGIAAPPAAPRAPVVTHTVAPTVSGAELSAPTRAEAVTPRRAKKEPAQQAQAAKQSAPLKAVQGKGNAKPAAATPTSGETSARKAAAKKAAPGQRAPGKAATKKAALKKTATKKAAAKKVTAKKVTAK